MNDSYFMMADQARRRLESDSQAWAASIYRQPILDAIRSASRPPAAPGWARAIVPSTASLKAEVERHLVGRVDEIAPKHLQACFDAARGALPLLARSIEHRLVQERRQKAEAKDMASGHDEDCPGPA